MQLPDKEIATDNKVDSISGFLWSIQLCVKVDVSYDRPKLLKLDSK